MIELFLDNKPAVLRDNVSIKLTRENVYFTKSGSYTYDIELPLGCAENRAILGNINRKDVETHYREFRAVLRVDNQVLLNGKAILHQVTDTAAKVQLMGGNAEMNFYTKGSELYVDELDLGDWFSIMNNRPEGEHHKGNAFLLFDQEHNAIYTDDADPNLAWSQFYERWWSNKEGEGSNRATDKGVMFPVINESASYREGTINAEANNMEGGGVIVNGFILRAVPDSQTDLYLPGCRYSWPTSGGVNVQSRVPQIVPSFQPMLVMMIVRVLKACGYPMEDDSEIALLSNSLFRHIFIVTANNRLELNKALPHWTVNEFITQVEMLLGIVIEIDEISKKSRVSFRNDFWQNNSSNTAIKDVVDEYSVEIDKEETTDTSNGNIAWDSVEDGFTHISEDILESVEIDTTRFTSIEAMQTALANGLITRSDKSKIFQAQGHQFIVVGEAGSYEFKEVNQLRMLKRNGDKKDADITLKIVPCPITEWEVPYVRTSKILNPVKNIYEYVDTVQGSKTVEVFTRPDISHIGTDNVNTDEEIDIEALIEGEQDTPEAEDKADLIYIGVIPLHSTYTWDGIRYHWPRPVCWHQWRITVNGIDPGFSINQREFLELNPTTSHPEDKSLYSEAMSDMVAIDTTVKHCIKFVCNKVIQPSGTFIIHGQRFACEKLEYNITSKGVSPIVTGYFYRLS